jgi:NAD(P)H-flavin reductase
MMDFHVKAADGGMLSTWLTGSAAGGDELRIGPPVGTLALDLASERDILMLAASTGLAPLLAILEQLAGSKSPPQVTLVFAASSPEELYDLPRLEQLAARHDWLAVITTVTAGRAPGYDGEHGTAAEAAARRGDWRDCDAYVCGSSAMVAESVRRLASLGIPGSRVHAEDFGEGQ